MPAGLEILNEDQSVSISITTSLARFMGSFLTGEQSGSAPAPGISKGKPFFFAIPVQPAGAITSATFTPTITMDEQGETISWVFAPGQFQSPCRITYGTF